MPSVGAAVVAGSGQSLAIWCTSLKELAAPAIGAVNSVLKPVIVQLAPMCWSERCNDWKSAGSKAQPSAPP